MFVDNREFLEVEVEGPESGFISRSRSDPMPRRLPSTSKGVQLRIPPPSTFSHILNVPQPPIGRDLFLKDIHNKYVRVVCSECRRMKVKCSFEGSPPCVNCRRHDFACSMDEFQAPRKSKISREIARVQTQVPPSPVPESSGSKLMDALSVNLFMTILSDKSKYKTFLNYEGCDAQKLLNYIQMLLDHQTPESSFKRDLLVALLRLSKKSCLFPQCLTLKGVERESTPLEAGHFGEIYKGSFQGQAVCLKVVKVYQKSRVQHLLRAYSKEAVLWSQLSHPNLLPFYGIYHIHDLGGRICLVSPWMQHGNVNEYLLQHPESRRLLLVVDIARGMKYLHKKEIVHGDLKGPNILVSNSGRARVADFGLSSVLDADIVRWTSIQSSGHSGGTVRWQAPELVRPSDPDPRPSKESDVYAFSSVCYEIFTGNVPFYEVSRDATVTYKIMSGERPSPPPADSMAFSAYGLTREIWAVMEDCWQDDPKDRPLIENIVVWLTEQGLIDKRPEDRDISPSCFRAAMHNAEDHLSLVDMENVIGIISRINAM